MIKLLAKVAGTAVVAVAAVETWQALRPRLERKLTGASSEIKAAFLDQFARNRDGS